MKKLEIEIHDATTEKPPLLRLVIISGGIGWWNGTDWLSGVGQDDGRPIEWEVKWWTPLIVA